MNATAINSNLSLWVTTAFAIAVVANVLLKFWLASRQIRHVAAHRSAVPKAFTSRISLAAHHKAADYTIAQSRLGMLELAWGCVTLLAWTLLGGLDALNHAVSAYVTQGLAQEVSLILCFIAISSLLDLPFSVYRTFVLEQRFGFNKTTWSLWVKDQLKSMSIGALIGVPLSSLILWLMGAMGTAWWIWTWMVWIGFNLLLLLIYPTWIAPLFNQFKPLDDPKLTARVSQLMERCGFRSKGFFVMDGSRRSAHANAYFTGFGASKRVVFYDTLLQQLSEDEVDAVLAHELGHFRHKHIVQRIVLLFTLSLIGFMALGWLSTQAWFYTGLGVIPNLYGPNNALALLLFAMAAPLITSFLSPLMTQLSRKHEFEADAYAASQTSGTYLGNALLKLYEDNASTLTPDPLYVKFYYSHPPAFERLDRLKHAAI
jgi:STE24 endopeptidase